jgi:hypothetical protein
MMVYSRTCCKDEDSLSYASPPISILNTQSNILIWFVKVSVHTKDLDSPMLISIFVLQAVDMVFISVQAHWS